jgi:hypothetical protein
MAFAIRSVCGTPHETYGWIYTRLATVSKNQIQMALINGQLGIVGNQLNPYNWGSRITDSAPPTRLNLSIKETTFRCDEKG